jgi:hypothetical protein
MSLFHDGSLAVQDLAGVREEAAELATFFQPACRPDRCGRVWFAWGRGGGWIFWNQFSRVVCALPAHIRVRSPAGAARIPPSH